MFSHVHLLKAGREKQGTLPFLEKHTLTKTYFCSRHEAFHSCSSFGWTGLNKLCVASFTTNFPRALLKLLLNDPRENKCSLVASFYHCTHNAGVWRSHKTPSKLMSCFCSYDVLLICRVSVKEDKVWSDGVNNDTKELKIGRKTF